MISAEIQRWKDKGQPFNPGLRLYRQIPATYPVSIFAGYEQANYIPPTLRNRLRDALLDYLKKNPVDENTIVSTAPSPKKKHTGEPETIKTLRNQAKSIHKLHSHTKALLIAAHTDAERYKHAHAIMIEIIPALDKIYNQIRAYDQTGSIPLSAILNDTDVRKKIGSIAPRISKLRKMLKDTTLSETKRTKYEKELADKELKLAKLKA